MDFGEGELQRCLDRIETFEKENKGKILIQECKDGREDMSNLSDKLIKALSKELLSQWANTCVSSLLSDKSLL